MRALFEGVKHSPGILDTQEVATLEQAVFGQSPAPRSRRAAASRGTAAGPEGIDEVERAVFGGPVAASTDQPNDTEPLGAAEASESPETTPDAADSGIPEADRLFAPPTPEEAARILRDLAWGEHIVATRMSTSRGNTQTYLFSFEQAVTFFMEEHAGGMRLATSGSTAWIDFDAFLAWIRDVLGDVSFAAALEERLEERSAYNDKLEALRQLLALRWAQLEPFAYPEVEETEDAGEGQQAADEHVACEQ